MLDAKKFFGPNAGSMKYDLLTALSVVGLSGGQTFQTSMTRLIALVTARYNWQMDELSVGQRDIARMWSVDERTVKREMKRLTDSGILKKVRQGVRGRVGAYRINYEEIWKISAHTWDQVGPDFSERMSINAPKPEIKVVKVDFSGNTEEEPPEANWRGVRRILKSQDEAIYQAWYSKLISDGLTNETLSLRAPNSFIARYVETNLSEMLFNAAKQCYPGLDRIKIITI